MEKQKLKTSRNIQPITNIVGIRNKTDISDKEKCFFCEKMATWEAFFMKAIIPCCSFCQNKAKAMALVAGKILGTSKLKH